MKKIYSLVLVVLAVVSCQKDPVDNNGTLRLTAEGMHGATKMAVDKNLCYWVTGDTVLINNDTFTVNVVSGEDATVESKPSGFPDAPYYGVYPARICSSLNLTTGSCELNIPARYTYATTSRGGRTLQKLRVPMVAYAANGPNIAFKHVTGALNVIVINHYGFTIQVDSIVVSSNKYQLCGSKTVTLGSTSLEVNAEETDNAALRRVSLIGGSSLTVLAGDTAIIQVPVLPVGSENRFTVEVGVHKNNMTEVKKKFNKTQGGSYAGTDYSLYRAEIGDAPVKFGGLFSVNSTKKVIISQGNLCYNKSSQEWSFLMTQYYTVESNESVGGEYTTTGRVTLFGWGTSGWNNGNVKYMPYNTGNASSGGGESYGYGPTDGSSYFYSLTGTYAHADWGVHNAISNGGNMAGRWRTLTSGQWDTLFTKRATADTVNGITGARYAFANVNSKNGIILFPDDFEPPTFRAGSYWRNINEPSEWDSEEELTKIFLNDWYLLEAEGAVFLPAAGMRSKSNVKDVGNKALYWSCNHHTGQASKAYGLSFQTNQLTINATDRTRNTGASVRLVHDMN